MRVRNLLAIGSAFALFVALVFVTVTLSPGPSKPAPPVQQTGTAAGLPHRVSAVTDLGRVVGGRVVSVSGTAQRLPASVVSDITSAREVPGAVRPAAKPKPEKLPVRGKPAQETLRALPAPAMRKVAGYNAATSRELAPDSADQVVYTNTDGTKTAFQYTLPVNYRLPDGTWTQISTSLVPAEAGSSAVTEKSEAHPESFAASAGAQDLATMPLDGAHSVSFGISGAAAVTGAVSGSTVSYADVRPGATVRFTAGTGLMQEDIVLSSPPTSSTWVFPLDLKGLRAQMGPGGIVEFADAAGKVLAYVPPGYMTDSNINPHSGDGATSLGVSYSLTTAGGRQAIRMTLDTAWLDSKSRVYPVTVDPSVDSVNTNGSTYVQFPETGDFSGDTELHVGTWDGGSDYAKSYLAFGNVASALKNDTVLGVQLGLYNNWSYSCSPRPVYVYPVTSSWSVTGSKSWPGPSTGAAIGRMSFATGWEPNGLGSPCPASWEGIVLDQSGVSLVNGWTHGTIADNGLAVGASNSDSYGWKKFTSQQSSVAPPFLGVTYTTDGASYRLAARRPVTPVTPSTAGKLAISVTNTGSSTWTTSNGFEMSYRAYNAKGVQVANHPVFTPMPSTVAPGGTVTVDVTVNPLPVGNYAINFDMYSGATGSSPAAFSASGIPQFPVSLFVPEPAPVINNVYPPTGYVSPTLQQQLSTSATETGTLTYDFTLTCAPLTGQTCASPSVTSGTISKPYWTPPAASMTWNTPYTWSVKVTGTSGSSTNSTTISGISLMAQVPQPVITSNLGGSQAAYDPLSGSYTTSATDAPVASVGPALRIDRTYNSMDPRTSGAFGAGWSSVVDTSLRDDGATVEITLPDGQQMRFGKNGGGSYVGPFGSPDVLVKNSSGTWTLRDASGNQDTFTSAGLILSITDPSGHAQNFAYSPANPGQVATITDAASGRTLSLTWSTPSGTPQPHVASVTTQAPAAGQAGLTWTYSYSGDDLTQVCAPATTGTGCTAYSYSAASHYQPSVLDAGPRDVWQLGEASGATAADEVDVNLGTTDGTYHNVTLGVAGPLAGSSESTAAFNGTTSYVSLPNNVVSDSTDVSVGLWFKAASGSPGGVLFSYDADAVTNSSGSSAKHEPLLYIGTNGDLYGEFWNGTMAPLHTGASVEDGKWHYAVITANSTSQSLYLDGAQVGSSLSGTINQQNMGVDTIGAGFWNGWTAASSTALSYFTGDIGQVAVYPVPLSAATIATQYAVATAASPAMTQTTLPSGSVQESATYDPATGRIATYTDANGGQWTISTPLATGYRPSPDSLGQVIDDVTVSGPAGRHVTYQFDMLDGGRVVSHGNGVDPPTDYGYDAAGFLASTVDPDGNLTCFTNDIHGNVLTKTWYPVEPATLPGAGVGANSAPCGGSTASSPACPTSGAPCTTFYSYYYNTSNPLDPRNDKLLTMQDGRSASVTDTTYLTSYTYNSAGQELSKTSPGTPDFPSGRTTKFTYSTGSETAANGGTIPAGLMLTQTTPGGAQTSYSYDFNGDLAQVKDPSGRYAQYTYDTLGRRLTSTVFTSTFTSGETTSYTYTPTGKPATVIYPALQNAVTPSVSHQLEDSYTYDADDNLLTKTESDLTGGDPPRTTTYTYNDHDQVATVTQPAGATTGGTAQSDGAASANPAGATTAYDYDAFGNVTQRTDPNGNQIRSTYNEYNEPTQEILYTSDTNASSSVATCSSPATQDADGGCDLVLRSKAYDPAGLLASETDAMGRTVNYTYDHDQKLIQTQITQACSTTTPCTSLAPCTPTAQCTTGTVGTLTTYTYDGAGNLVSRAVAATHTGAAGTASTTDFTYDAADRLTTEVQDAPPASGGTGYQSRTTSYTYNADDQVLSQTVGTGTGALVADFGYDTAGNMTSQTVVGSGTNLETTWTYDQDGHPLSMTTPRGNASGATAADYTTNYAYDPAGELITTTGPPVAVSSFASPGPAAKRPVTNYGYDTFGDRTQVQDPNLNVTTTAYDGDGRKTSMTQAPYTAPGELSAITATTSYTYDEAGNLASLTDPAGNVVNYTYDALGDMTSKTVPQPSSSTSAPGQWTYTYDSDGEQLSAKDPLGNTTSQTYDYFGNVASSTDALQNTTRYGHDYLGGQTMQDTPDGSVSTSTYDHLGELASSTDGAGNTTSYTYNGQGNVAQVTNPDGTSAQFGYDQAGQLTSVSDWSAVPAGGSATKLRSESFGYDADGNQISATDWNGNTTTDGYNALGELTSATQPVSSSASITTSYGYDAAGNQTSATDGNGNTRWTTYNTWNLPESVVEPTTSTATSTAETTWTTAYDANGNPATVTEPGGVSLSYGYDSLGDVTSESGSGASASTDARSFSYDLDGQLTSATAPDGTDSFTYDGNGNLTGASGPSGASSYTYNGDGLVASQTAAAGTTSYTYDTADRLSTESEPLTGSTLSYAYNSDGNPASISYATGGKAGPVQAFGYDSLGQVTSDTITSASGATLASLTYGHDANGNITSQATGGLLANASTTYAYDEANRLTSSTSGGTTTSYAYDNAGNMTQDGSVTNTYDAQNQLTSSTSSAGTTSYSYTLNGDLSSVTPASGPAQSYTWDAYGNLASAGGVSYGYDALDRMVSRTTSSGSTSLSYLGTSDSLASDGTSDYTYTPSGSVTAAGTPGGTAFTTMTDQHGDVVASFSPTSTAAGLAGSSSYSPYGASTATGYQEKLGYQGDYTDPSTGLVYMNARWYDPATGTFVSGDTVGGSPVPSAVDGNPYAYASANPMTETDPSGHMPAGCGLWCVIGWGACGPGCVIGCLLLCGGGGSSAPPIEWYTPEPYYTPYNPYPWTPPTLGPTWAVPFGGGQINDVSYRFPGPSGPGCGWQCYAPPAPPPAAPAPPVPAPPGLRKKVIAPPAPPDTKNPKDIPPPRRVPDPAPPAPQKPPPGTEPSPDQKSPDQYPEPLPIPTSQDANNCFTNGTPQDPVYGPLQTFPGVDGGGRATKAEACLTGFRKGSKATANFPGWDGATMDRTHLLAREFGGAGGRKNVVPFGWWANQVTMRYYELQIGALFATNQRVFYEILPLYGPITKGTSINNFMPFAIELIWGTKRSGLVTEFIENSLATQPARGTRRRTNTPFTVIAD